MTRSLSDDGAAFIADQEGSVDHWYRDAGGWSIGIGHAGDPSVEFIDVATEDDLSVGRRLSDAEMWVLFRLDASRYIEAVDRLVTVDLTQHQFDSAVDFAFNWGIGESTGFPATSILRLLNAGDFAAVAHELVNGSGPSGRPYDKGLAHVRRRRELEAEAFVVTPLDIMRRVAARLEAWDVPVAYVPGWETRGRPYSFGPHMIRNHHTATRGYDYDYPSLAIVRDGRSDLPGPLSQFGGGRHTGTVYFIAAGYANDGGTGGWNGYSGNGSGWGIEWENDGIGEAWGPEIRRSAVLLNVALCLETPVDPADICEHFEWSIYKIDRANFGDPDDFRAEVAALVATGGPVTNRPPTPDPIDKEFRMPFIYPAPKGQGWLWDPCARIHSYIGSGQALAAFMEAGIPEVRKDTTEAEREDLHKYLTSLATNANFTG